MKLDKLTEATMLALRGKLNEVKGSSKTYTCIEDRQGGDFALGKTMTAEEWGEEAYSWAYGDDWTNPEEPLLKNFKTEKECLDFIQDMWEITIVPSDSPEAKEFLGEARSHKECDNKTHQICRGIKNKQNKKVTEATTDVNEVYDEYKKAYHKDLDLKTVPCVIARDKMLSGWGGAEGRTHYQVVLCADRDEADNIASNMQSRAKREQLANIRMSFGVKLPSRASVAYVVGRYAPAWNMGDSWYARYDNKKEEGRRETKLGNKIVRWAYENFKDIAFIEDGKLSDGSDYLEFDASRPKLEEFKKALATEFGNNIEFGTSQSEYAPEIKNLVVIIPKKSNKKEETKSIKVKGLRKTEVKNKKLENIQGNHQGICPKCGSMITNYGHIFWDDEGIGQEFNCTNPECKAHGTEYYNTTFDYIEAEEN